MVLQAQEAPRRHARQLGPLDDRDAVPDDLCPFATFTRPSQAMTPSRVRLVSGTLCRTMSQTNRVTPGTATFGVGSGPHSQRAGDRSSFEATKILVPFGDETDAQ